MRAALAALLLLTACSNNPSSSYPGRLDPIVGQWTAYGTATGVVGHLSNPFIIPTQVSGKSINYVYTGLNNTLAGTIALNYSITGGAQFGVADGADIPPATIRLFIWGKNSDTGNDRWWCKMPVALTNDSNILSCSLDSNNWTGVNGQEANASPAFNAALASPFAVGFTFGGQYFAGHGVWTTSGGASFKIDSFTVQ